MKKFLSLILICLVCATVNAREDRSYATGKVKMLMVHTNDIVMFDVGTHHNKPACSTIADDWALSLNSEKGKAMYAMLLSAAAQDLTLTVIGDDACNAWGDRESPHIIMFTLPQ